MTEWRAPFFFHEPRDTSPALTHLKKEDLHLYAGLRDYLRQME